MITDEIRTIAERIQKIVNPQKIYLFGSFARDEEKDDRDYDFYLVKKILSNTRFNVDI